MADTDERIRTELRGLSRDVPVEGVLERVARRKARRRVVRRFQAVSLAVAVVAGSIAGGIGLTRLFGHPGTVTPGSSGPSASAPAPSAAAPNPTSAGGGPSVEEMICDQSQLYADVDGDGVLDQVDVYSPAPSCDSPEAGKRYVLHVSGGKQGPSGPGVWFYGLDQDLPECLPSPFPVCRLFAAPDIDGDGAAELAIRIEESASADNLALYRLEGLDTAAGPRFVRIAVAPPGDERFPPGPATFRSGGSNASLDGLECRSDGGPLLVASSAGPTEGDPGHYDVHETQFSLHGDELRIEATADYPDILPDQNPPFVTPTDLCGAPIVVAGG